MTDLHILLYTQGFGLMEGMVNHMAYILDAAVIIIFLLMLAIGYRRGLVKSLLRLGGSILAMLAAWGIAAAVAAPIFDAAVAPGLQELAAENITAADAATLNEQLTALLDKLPGPIANGLAACGVGSAEEITAHLGGAVGTTADAVADALVNDVFRPVGVLLIRMVSFLLLFIVLMIAAHFLANVISKVFRLPLLRQADGLLGALFGAVEGVILALAAVTVMQMLTASTAEDALISQQDIEDTVIVSAMAEINPVTGTLESVLENVR